MDAIPLSRVWAKTNPATGIAAVWLLTHSINVGAVGAALLTKLSPAARQVFPREVWQGLVSLAASHDIGKASPGFLRKCAAWVAQADPGPAALRDWASRETNHAAVSHLVLGQWFGQANRAGYAVAAGGHHGKFTGSGLRPALSLANRVMQREIDDPVFRQARLDLLTRLQADAMFGTLPTEPLPSGREHEARIVFLTGFITLADWIGSDEAFFGLEDASPDRELETLAHASEQAGRALGALRWGEAAPVPDRFFGSLFCTAGGEPYAANPLQEKLAGMVQGAGLYIVEAPMGGGKTEAALHAAYLRWTQGGERGLYFALPTQLTSDRIFERVNPFLARAIAGPALSTLAHGSAWLREQRAIEVHPAGLAADPAADLAADARQWFASGRRALLAPFGAGTLDQALLSVLPAKHCGLRLFSLAGKVVVCDEVHSYDPYTSTLLDALVSDLLRLHCTVIVLTATLPAARKAQLLKAAGVEELPASAAYPLITRTLTGSGSAEACEVPPEPADRRQVRLEHYLENDPAPWERACAAAETGACVLIIRNTVARAQQTYREVKGRRRGGGPPVALLHSRFPRWRRDGLESVWLTRLGKADGQKAGEGRPAGCILVATQVVEQSVDIDADLLITDLAPTDPLLQRMGRLHRHPRARPAGFEAPQTWLLHPELSAAMTAKEIKGALGASGKVYPPATLFRTWQLWHARLAVSLPDAIRPLLDQTYAPPSGAEPAGWRALQEELDAQVAKRTGTAKGRMARLSSEAKDDRDDGSQTRWIEQPTADLLLLREAPRPAGAREWDLPLLDGGSVRVSPYRWELAAAQKLHQNIVSVPLYAVRAWTAEASQALGQYLEGGARIGVAEGGRIKPLHGEEANGYKLGWHEDEGVDLSRAEAPSGQRRQPREEWDEDFDD